jgi:hypothetical protein
MDGSYDANKPAWQQPHQLMLISFFGRYEREITKSFRVQPGRYLIVPSTSKNDEDYDFMMRVFTENKIDST